MNLLRRVWFAPLVVFALALTLRRGLRPAERAGDRPRQRQAHAARHLRVLAVGAGHRRRRRAVLEAAHAYHLWTEDVAPESKWLEWYGGERTYHQAPLYAYFVAAVYWTIDRTQETLGLVQAVLGALTCALTVVLARRLVSPLAGWVAGLALALMASSIFTTPSRCATGRCAAHRHARAGARHRGQARPTRDWLAAGAVLGLFALAKETACRCSRWRWSRWPGLAPRSAPRAARRRPAAPRLRGGDRARLHPQPRRRRAHLQAEHAPARRSSSSATRRARTASAGKCPPTRCAAS